MQRNLRNVIFDHVTISIGRNNKRGELSLTKKNDTDGTSRRDFLKLAGLVLSLRRCWPHQVQQQMQLVAYLVKHNSGH